MQILHEQLRELEEKAEKIGLKKAHLSLVGCSHFYHLVQSTSN